MAEGPDDENSLSYQSLRPPEYLHLHEKHPPPSPLSSCPNTPQRSVASSIGMDSLDRHPELTIPALHRSKSSPLPKKIAVPKTVTTAEDEKDCSNSPWTPSPTAAKSNNIRGRQEEKKDNDDDGSEHKLRTTGRRTLKATIVTESSITRTFKITKSPSMRRVRLPVTNESSDDETASINNIRKEPVQTAPLQQQQQQQLPQRKRPLPPRSPAKQIPSPTNNADCPEDEKARTPNQSKSQPSPYARPPLPTPPSANQKPNSLTAPDDEGKIVSSKSNDQQDRYSDMDDTPDDEEISDPGIIISSKSGSSPKKTVLVPDDDVPLDELVSVTRPSSNLEKNSSLASPKNISVQVGDEIMTSSAVEDSETTPKATTATSRALKMDSVPTDEKQQGSPAQLLNVRSPGTEHMAATPHNGTSTTPTSFYHSEERIPSPTATTTESSAVTTMSPTTEKQHPSYSDARTSPVSTKVNRVVSLGTTVARSPTPSSSSPIRKTAEYLQDPKQSKGKQDATSDESYTVLESLRHNNCESTSGSVPGEEQDQGQKNLVTRTTTTTTQKPQESDDSVLGTLWNAAESTALAATDTAYFATEAGMALMSSGAAAGKLLESLVLGPEDKDDDNRLANILLAANKSPPLLEDSSTLSNSLTKNNAVVANNTQNTKNITRTSSTSSVASSDSETNNVKNDRSLPPMQHQQDNQLNEIDDEEVEVEMTPYDNGNEASGSMGLSLDGALPITVRVSSHSSSSTRESATSWTKRENNTLDTVIPMNARSNSAKSSVTTRSEQSIIRQHYGDNGPDVVASQKLYTINDDSYDKAPTVARGQVSSRIGPSFDESSVEESGGGSITVIASQRKLLIPDNDDSDPEVEIYDSEGESEEMSAPPSPTSEAQSGLQGDGIDNVQPLTPEPKRSMIRSGNGKIETEENAPDSTASGPLSVDKAPLSPRPLSPRSFDTPKSYFENSYGASGNGFISPVLSDQSVQDTLNFSLDDEQSHAKFYDSVVLPKDPLQCDVEYIPIDKDGKPFLPENVVQFAKSGISNSTGSDDGSLLDVLTSFDDVYGVAKGDVMLSLLSSKFGQNNPDTDGSVQVRNAIQRIRDLGRTNGFLPPRNDTFNFNPPNSPVMERLESHKGGGDTISKLHRRALSSMKHDDFDRAAEIYEDVVAFSSGKLKKQEKESEIDDDTRTVESTDYKSLVATALYNLATIFLLKEEYEEASDLFKQSSEMRESSPGNHHIDHITSLVNQAFCYFAMNDFPKSRSILLESLELCKQKNQCVSDFTQLGEILNNLGCLSFLLGHLGTAIKLFRESTQVLSAVQNRSVYVGTRQLRQTVGLNISVASSNLGFIQLCIRDYSAATAAFEEALVYQQNLLDDSQETLIATMDHLVIANFLAGNKQKALQIMERLYDASVCLYGKDDSRCELLVKRMSLIENNGVEYKGKIERHLQVPGHQKVPPQKPSTRSLNGKRH